MANASELLRLIIQADTQGAVKGLEAVGHAADKGLGGAQARADKLAGNLTKFGAVAVAAGAVAAKGLYSAAKSASDLGEQVSQSSQIFGDASDEIGSFAKGAAGSLGQSERAAREAANTFGLFFTNAGKSKTEAAGMSIELTKLASDMASFKNTSPEEAVEALGAALRGESEPIRRYGVMLDDATLKQRALSMGLIETTTGVLPPAIKMQAAYAEILEQTGTVQGDFARTSDGLANQQRILAAEFENAKAAIGAGALPVLTKLTGVAADAASGFASLDEKTGGAVGTLSTIATGALLVGGGLSVAVGQAIKMRENLGKLTTPFMSAEGGLTKLGVAGAGVGVGIGLFAAAMFKAQQRAENLKQAAAELRQEAERTGKTLDEVVVAKLARTFAESDQVARAMDDLGVSFEDLKGPLQGSQADFDAWRESMLEADRQVGATGDQGDLLADRVKVLRAELAEAEQVTGRTAEAQKALGVETGEAATATEEFSGTQETAAEKTERLKEELDEATEAITKNYEAMYTATNLAIDYEAGIDDLIASLKENGRTLDITTEKGRDNVRQVQDTGGAIAALIRQRYEETGSVKDAAAAGDLYVANLRNQLKAAGFTEKAVEELIAQMHLTPAEIRTNLLADTTDATKNLTDYQRLLNSTPRLLETTINGVTFMRPNRVDHNASGTPYFGGGLTWVGERGPEIVELPRGTAIHDAQKSAAMVGGGGTRKYEIVVNALDPKEAGPLVVEAIHQYERSNGTSWRN